MVDKDSKFQRFGLVWLMAQPLPSSQWLVQVQGVEIMLSDLQNVLIFGGLENTGPQQGFTMLSTRWHIWA